MASSTVFITATDARQNPIREHVVHDEARAIESAILDAVALGQFSTIVSDGTPMTQSTNVASPVITLDPTTSIFTVPNHGFSSGDAVKVNSTGALPAPLVSTGLYYVIFVDVNSVKLAASQSDALAGRPIPITVSEGVTAVDMTEKGSGYFGNPSVTITGGDPTTPATALAYLANYGSLASITVNSSGSGYNTIPIVSIVPQGSGAVVSTVTLKVVQAAVSAPGANYRIGDILSVIGGTGSVATLIVAQIGTNGSVVAININSSGDYSTLPSLNGTSTAATPGGGTGCTVNLSMGLSTIGVANGGSGYTGIPVVIINSASGTGAMATAALVAGTIGAITVTNPGSGYASIPSVSFTSGENATAEAVLQPTGISNITLSNNGGNTYETVPAVTITAHGSGAAVGQVYVRVCSAMLVNGGSGYTIGDTLLIAGGAGSTAASITVTNVDGMGQVTGYVLSTSGLYRQMPILDNNSVIGGTGSAATFNLTMSLDSIDVSSGGSGYVRPPQVIITSSSGYGAAAISKLDLGEVVAINVIAYGTGFTDIPEITLSNGSGATAVAHLTPTEIGSFVVTGGGSGYTYANVVIGGDGIGASATANLLGGSLDSITLDTAGSGYTYPPPVTITGDGNGATAYARLVLTSIDHISVTNSGSGYNSRPTVYMPGAAHAYSILNNTGVDRIDIINPGDNYTSTPIVNVLDNAPYQIGPTVAPATTTSIGYSIDHITVVNAGIGYQYTPTVSINAPTAADGIQATADASIGIGAGNMSLTLYPPSLDYFAVWKSTSVSNDSVNRPYADRMDTVIAYFTNLGYTINRQTNPATNNTLQWSVKW
jgi:hypothetical protein